MYSNFYQNFYVRTGGFIPTKPLNQTIFPGDFFQIKNGEMNVLENIFRKGVVDRNDAAFGTGIKLNPASWIFSDGVTKTYSGRGTGHAAMEGKFELNKEVIAFAQKGSFIFNGHKPESVKILNWNEVAQQLIIRLTQTMYSFRELYVVTETVAAEDWTLAIAGSDGADLEIAADSEGGGLAGIFGHSSAKTIRSKDIEYYHRETKRKPVFFKAKKLVAQEEKLEIFISGLNSDSFNWGEWLKDFFVDDLDQDPVHAIPGKEKAQKSFLDMLHANDLSPETALLYFKWADASLDDVRKLFLTYGD